MCFVNTIIVNVTSINLQINPVMSDGIGVYMTGISAFAFLLSLVLAIYISFLEYRNEKKQKNQTQFSTLPENNIDDAIIPSPIDVQTSMDVPPSSEENTLPNSRSLLSAFEAVSLPAMNVPSSSESAAFPAEPVLSSLKPQPLKPQPLKPQPLRPKPIPLPIEPPPAYYISNLQIEPIKAIPGDTIFVSFIITSNTATSDSFPISLKVNGFEIYSNNIVLYSYESKSLTYPIRAIEPGDWDISVNNLLCKLTIVEDIR